MKEYNLELEGVNIPIHIIIEPRRGYRASFTKKGLNIRLPNYYSIKKREEVTKNMVDWARETVIRKPTILNKYDKPEYKTGSVISTFDDQFTIEMLSSKNKHITGKILGNTIQFFIPETMSANDVKPGYVSKLLAKEYKHFFSERILFWSNHFSKQPKQFRLKYNSSNWGSCSSKGNINLSTRLLLCPPQVIDYVIVHELAHLIHPNHSKSFWQEVKRVMPDFKTHATWLKTKGAHLDF